MNSFHETAFNVFNQFPDGLACFEFIQLMDADTDRRNASARLSQFVNEGLAKKEGVRFNEATGQTSVVYKPTGKPFSERVLENREPTRKRKRPTDQELIDLRRANAEHIKWKTAAIARFPELAVAPAIMRARTRLAEILRHEGNVIKAHLVESGDMDDSEAMRIVLSITEAGQ